MSDIIYGYLISLLGGLVTVSLFLKLLRWWITKKWRTDKKTEATRSVPPWLTGVIERLFFTTLVYLNLPGIPPSMMIWLTLKMVTNHNSPLWKNSKDTEEFDNRIKLSMAALLAGVVSLGFALIGGLIAKGNYF